MPATRFLSAHAVTAQNVKSGHSSYGDLLVFGACEAAVEDGIMAGLKSQQLQT